MLPINAETEKKISKNRIGKTEFELESVSKVGLINLTYLQRSYISKLSNRDEKGVKISHISTILIKDNNVSLLRHITYNIYSYIHILQMNPGLIGIILRKRRFDKDEGGVFKNAIFTLEKSRTRMD